mgnify:FL=1
MEATMTYSDFTEGSPSLSSILAELSNQVEMSLNIIPSTTLSTKNLCEIKLKDKIGVDEISETINKEDVKQLLNILKIVYIQLQNMDSLNTNNTIIQNK